MARKLDKVLATDASVGAAAVAVAWAVSEFTPLDLGVLEAGAFVVPMQSGAHKLADRFGGEDD